MPLKGVRGHEDFKELVLSRINQQDKPVITEGSQSLVSRDEIFSIKAELIDLSFTHDTEYFLQKNLLDFAEILFFDEIPPNATVNELNVDTVNKQLTIPAEFEKIELINNPSFETGDSTGWTTTKHSGWTSINWGATDWKTDGTKSCKMASYGSRSIYQAIDLTNALSLKFDWKINRGSQGTVTIALLIDGTQVWSVSRTSSGTGTAVIDVSAYSGIHTIQFKATMYDGDAVWVDNFRYTVPTGKLVLSLSQNPITDVMVLVTPDISANLGTDIFFRATDGVNTVDITQLKTLQQVSLSKLDFEIEAKAGSTVVIDNLAILWRESV